MALSQEDRIAISKKIVDIPRENESAESLKNQLDTEIQKIQKADNANKSLMDAVTPLIDAYQSELQRYDGNGRLQLTEQNMVDSADRTLQNLFFPNDPQTSLPNISDGVWKLFVPFSNTVAVGKRYTEDYDIVTKEQNLIDEVNVKIAAVEAFVDATRSSSDECVGTCSNPTYMDQTSCTNNGGTWSEGKQPSTDMVIAGQELKDVIVNWENFLNATFAIVDSVSDTNGTRIAGNTASKDDITNAISVIDSWQALQDYDTITITPGTCAAFNAFGAGNFDPSKFRAAELQAIKDEITAREIYIASRISELENSDYLGSISQDFNTGDLLGGDGLYLKRFRYIDMRLNAIGGTLSKLRGFERGKDAQQQLQNSNNNAEIALTEAMAASALRSPATGTSTIHVLDGSLFSPSDNAYVVTDTQAEISVTIQSVNGNRIVLDKKIPEKYRHTEGARLYKEL